MDNRTVTEGRLNVGLFVQGSPSNPPQAPSNLTATATSSSQITLAWIDNSSDEQGFRIERCTGSQCTNFAFLTNVGANAIGFPDSGLSASTVYRYRVRSYKDAQASAWSNEAQATTSDSTPPPSGAIALTATGYKVKGVQWGRLRWSGATTANVDVFRGGAKVATTGNDGAHEDNIGKKGGGSYVYKVCEAGTSTCSTDVTVTF
jgi:hypothetical protein